MTYGSLTNRTDWEGGLGRNSTINRKPNTVFDIRKNDLYDILSSYVATHCNNALELGCGSGYYTSSILSQPHTLKKIYGIDFSRDLCQEFIKNVQRYPVDCTVCIADILSSNTVLPTSQLDWVYSGGLTEHFYGSTFDKILWAHHKFLRQGGFLSISVPNFHGINYFWHYIFDRPSLLQHNLMAMRPEPYVDFFEGLGYKTLFCDYVDTPHFWGLSTSELIHNTALRMSFLGISDVIRKRINFVLKTLHNSKTEFLEPSHWAPYFLYITRK